MKLKTTKQISNEAQAGAANIANSKLCWELTDRQRNFLSQEIYHLVMKITLEALENHIENHIIKHMDKRQIIIDKRR